MGAIVQKKSAVDMKPKRIGPAILLKLVADLLEWILHPFLYAISLIILICKGDKQALINYNYNLGLAKDRYGNVLIAPIGNAGVLIKKDSPYPYGDPLETISAVSGINIEGNYATGAKTLCKILHVFDKCHCEKAAENFILLLLVYLN